MDSFISILIAFGLLLLIGFFTSSDEWRFEESPNTGICYEIREQLTGFSISQTMNFVDDSYCDE